MLDLGKAKCRIAVAQSTVLFLLADLTEFDAIGDAAPMIRRRLPAVTLFLLIPVVRFLVGDGNYERFRSAASRIVFGHSFEDAKKDILYKIFVVGMMVTTILGNDLPDDGEDLFGRK